MHLAHAVGSLKHACSNCGGSCHGVRVQLISAEEDTRIRTLGAELGVTDPVTEGRLRFEQGRCVFLDAGGCRLHARYGAAAKPTICRQYPLVVTDTGKGQRVGIDPGCYSAWASRHTAAAVPLSGALAHSVPLDERAERNEGAVMAVLTQPGQTLSGALQTLIGQPADAFAGRWIQRLQASQLDELLLRPETGRAVRDALSPTITQIQNLDPSHPPQLQLAPEQDQWAVEVAARMVGLRLAPTMPVVQAVALLALGGALAVSWTDARPEPFGKALAGWARAMRAPIFWQAILPGPEAIVALVG
jgi:Fe-S-cluster containining protein